VTIHLLPKSHGLLADVRASIVHLVAARRWYAGPCLLPTHHVLIELYVGKLLRVGVLLHIVSSVSATVVGVSVNVGRLANVETLGQVRLACLITAFALGRWWLPDRRRRHTSNHVISERVLLVLRCGECV
jgi:hypothetical protein